jgi:hypothetical protein
MFPTIEIRPRYLIVLLGQLFAGFVKAASCQFVAVQPKVNAPARRLV